MGTSSIFPTMQPGIVAGRVSSHKVLFHQRDETYLAGGKRISGGCSRDPSNTTDVTTLQTGLLMGKISTVVNSLGTIGNYAPSILGVTTNAEAAGSTTIEAAAAVVTELVRRCGTTGTFTLTGPATANGVVNSETVTYSSASGTSITVTAIANAYVAGSFIQPTDGSQEPLSPIDDLVLGGYSMVDQSGASVTAVDWPRVPITGTLKSTAIVNWPSDTSLQAWIVSRVNGAGGRQFNWTHIL